MFYPVIYTGVADLREAIRDRFEAEYYTFISAESPEGKAAIAEGEYATIDYHGGETALIADVPVINPMTITLPITPNGVIEGSLAAQLILANLEQWGASAVADIEARAARLRESGSV